MPDQKISEIRTNNPLNKPYPASNLVIDVVDNNEPLDPDKNKGVDLNELAGGNVPGAVLFGDSDGFSKSDAAIAVLDEVNQKLDLFFNLLMKIGNIPNLGDAVLDGVLTYVNDQKGIGTAGMEWLMEHGIKVNHYKYPKVVQVAIAAELDPVAELLFEGQQIFEGTTVDDDFRVISSEISSLASSPSIYKNGDDSITVTPNDYATFKGFMSGDTDLTTGNSNIDTGTLTAVSNTDFVTIVTPVPSSLLVEGKEILILVKFIPKV